MPLEKLPHIVLTEPPETNRYTTPSSPPIPPTATPTRDRASHGQFLQTKFDLAWQESEKEQAVGHSTRSGVYLEFKSDPDTALITKSLEEMRSKQVRLLNVRSATVKIQDTESGQTTEQVTTYATVYVANSKKRHFLKKIEEYLSEDTRKGKPKNQRLVNSIADIRKALLVDSFWTDLEGIQPTTQPEWIEVWLSTDDDTVIEEFEGLLEEHNLQFRDGVIKFPERAVKVILATATQLEILTTRSAYIAEYRRAKETAAFYVGMSNREQVEWIESMQERLRVDDDSASTVCILDTGVNNGHPLLAPILGDADCQSVDQAWGGR